MEINPINFDLTDSEIRKIDEGWRTTVEVKDFSDAGVSHYGNLDQDYFSKMKEYAKKHIEPDEKWVVKDLGPNEHGTRQYEYRLYKGPRPKCGKPRSRHLKIRFTLYGVRHHLSRAFAGGGRAGGLAGGLLKGVGDVFCAVMAMFTVDMLFPPKEGESTFGRDFLVGWATLEYLDASDRQAQLEARVAQLESEQYSRDDE